MPQYSHDIYELDTFDMTDGQSRNLEPGVYKVRCFGTSMDKYCGGNSHWEIYNWSSRAASGGIIEGNIVITTARWCYIKESPGGSEGSNGYDSYSGSGYWHYHASGGVEGGDGIGFYIPSLSNSPLLCAGGGGGMGGECYGSSYETIDTDDPDGSNVYGPMGGTAGNSGTPGTYGSRGSSGSGTNGGNGGNPNGSGTAAPDPTEVYDLSGVTVYTATGGGGGGGWPAGGGGSESSCTGREDSKGSIKTYSVQGYSGGAASQLSTTVTLGGTSYKIYYYRGGSGSSGGSKYSSMNSGNADGGGGAGGSNYYNPTYVERTYYGTRLAAKGSAYVTVTQYIIMNDVQCITNSFCQLETSAIDVIANQEIEIYISNVVPGYTLNTVTLYNTNGYSETITLTYNDYNGEFYTASFTIPNVADQTFNVIATVFENPYLTIQREHYWAIKDTIGLLALNRGIVQIIDTVRTLRPDIYAAAWLVEVYMYNGWEFSNCVITCNEDPEFSIIINDFGEVNALQITPDMAGNHYVFNINENESKIPCYFQYYVYNIMRDVYYLRKTETLFGSAAGDIIQYTPEQQKGYDIVGDSTKYVTLDPHGSALSIYFTPKIYNLTVLYGTVETSINGTGTYKGQAYYTEPVKITFNRNKYENDGEDPRDDFDHWKSEEGFNIEQHTEVITFEMPYEDLTLYPVMRSFRKNSNIFKNKYPLDAVYGDYIYNGYMNNLVYDGDVKQENHGFLVGHAIYYDQAEHKYKKALADGTEKSNVIGVVHNVNSKDTFGYQIYGHTEITKYPWRDTRSTIMYLSDKTPGQLVFYEDIENNIYVPVAIWTKYGIIMCITQGTNGFPMKEYPIGNLGPECETYTAEEIQETIDVIKQNMVRSE